MGWRKWLVISTALLFTGLVLAVVGLLYTQPGLQFAWDRAQPWVPEELSVDRVAGRLVGPIRLEGVHWEEADAHVRLEELDLEWRPGMLVFGTFQVDRLDLAGLDVELTPEEEVEEVEAEPFQLPESLSLPLRLRLEALSLRHAEIRAPGLEEALHLDRLELAGGYAGEQLSLEQIQVEGPDLELDGALDLRTAGRWPVNLNADWSLDLVDLPPLAGATELMGDLDRIQFHQDLHRPFDLEADGSVTDPLGEASLDGNFRFENLRADKFDPDAPAGSFSGDLGLRGNRELAEIHGELEAMETDYGEWALRLDIAAPVDLDWIEAEELYLEELDRDLFVDLSGRIEDPRGDRPAFDGEVSWGGLVWPLEGEPEYRSDAGWARIDGHADAFVAELEAELAGEWEGQDLAGELQLDAEGSRDYLEAFSGQLNLEDGPELGLTGRADWRAEERFAEGDFHIRDFDPALVDADWPGMLSATGSGRVHWPDSGIEGEVDLHSLEGSLLGEPLAARGGVAYRPGTVELRQVEVESGPDRVRGDGLLRLPGEEGRSDLDFDLELTDLARLPLDTRGSLSAQGRIGGTPERPDGELELEARDLERGADTIGSLTLAATLADGGYGDSRLILNGRDMEIGGERFARLDVDGRGTRESHALTLDLEHALVELALGLSGGGAEDFSEWIGQLEALEIQRSPAGDWALEEPVALEWREEIGRLAEACLMSGMGRGRICLEGSGDAEGHWQAAVQGRGMPLAQFVDPEVTGLILTGDMNLELEARDQGDGPEADGNFWISPALLSQMAEPEDTDAEAFRMTLAELTSGQGSFQWRDNQAWGLVDIQLADEGEVTGEVRLPDLEAGTLAGRIDIFLAELGILPVLIPEVGRSEGQLHAGLDLTGDLGNPGLDGEIRIENGLLGLPDLGIVLEELFVRLQGSPEAVELALDAESGDGPLEARGQVDRIEDGWQGELRIHGDRFRAARLPEAEVYISPDLLLAVDGRRIDVTGELEIPSARIRPREMRGVVQASPDEVLAGDLRDLGQEDERYQIYSRVRTTLGDDVDFQGFGLEGKIRGNITTIDEPGRLTRAIGELEVVEGRYEAWRQRLEIERGRLIYTDTPVQDPALDVRAVRRPRNVVVGVQVRGTLRQPTLDLFSEPSMSQSEQLSYLLTGMPLTETGEGDRDVVREATAALRMAGGEYVGERLGQRLGVDDVSIETGEGPDETTVVLGKWISSDVYVSYGIGLLDTASVFRLRYNMSRRWDLEAQSGPRAGADFIYSLERGRPDD